jgi:hypothetical protein
MEAPSLAFAAALHDEDPAFFSFTSSSSDGSGGFSSHDAELEWPLGTHTTMQAEDTTDVLAMQQQLSLPHQPPLLLASPSFGAAAAELPIRPNPRAKKQRRNYTGVVLTADQVEVLLDQDLPSRPLALDTTTQEAEVGGWVFKETGRRLRRERGADLWRRCGGASETTDLPRSEAPRIRRRHGYLIPRGGGQVAAAGSQRRLRYHQYNRLVPPAGATPVAGATAGGGVGAAVEDEQTSLFHVLKAADHVAQPISVVAAAASGAAAAGAASVSSAMPTAGATPRTTQLRGSLHVDARTPQQQQLGNAQPLLHLTSAARAAGQTTTFVAFEEVGSEVPPPRTWQFCFLKYLCIVYDCD